MEDVAKELFAYLRRESISQKEAARMLGVSENTITNWKRGGVVDTKNARAIKLLTASDAPRAEVEPFTGPVKDFPVISEAAAAQCNTAFVPIADWADEYAESRVSFSEGRAGDFVLRVSGTSMLPWYPPNTLILARPNERPKNGDRVIAVLADGSVVFKVFAENKDHFFLLSVNETDGQDFKFAKTDFAAVRAIYLVIQSMRDERALDRAMDEKGLSHFWEKKIQEIK